LAGGPNGTTASFFAKHPECLLADKSALFLQKTGTDAVLIFFGKILHGGGGGGGSPKGIYLLKINIRRKSNSNVSNLNRHYLFQPQEKQDDRNTFHFIIFLHLSSLSPPFEHR